MIEAASLRSLEFDRVLSHLTSLCATELGRKQVMACAPMPTPAAAILERDRLCHYRRCLDDGAGVRLSDMGDVGLVLAHLMVAGSSLSGEQIVPLIQLLEAAEAIEVFLERQDDTVVFAAMWTPRPELDGLYARITAVIDERGAVRDDASPELASARAKLTALRGRLERAADRFFDAHGEIAERIATVRDERTVVAVRSDLNPSRYGFVHGRSASGATFYVEPFGLLELNNELIGTREMERHEIERLLRELSARLVAVRPDLEAAADLVAEFDSLQARVRLSREYGGGEVDHSPSGDILLEGSRHPSLIHAEAAGGGVAVPLDLDLAAGASLVITGPNTGGKTVALKTVGLALLHFAHGLPVPAARARLPLLRSLVVDLGDPQDIAQSLSTFSGHLKVIARALEPLQAPAVVLLDELGAGTDPREGGALGVAIVEHLRRAGVTTLVTSHHEALKAYALSTPGVRPASVEFDVERLQPTYRLRMDRTESSNALHIASRLGIPAAVIAKARELLVSETGDIERSMAEMERAARAHDDARSQLNEERAALELARAELSRSRERLESAAAELKERERGVRQRLRAEVDTRLGRALDEVRQEGVKLLNNMDAEGSPRRLDRAMGKLARVARAGAVRAVGDSLDAGPERGPSGGPLAIGDRVKVRAFGVIGEIVAVGTDELVVAASGKRLRVAPSGVERTAADSGQARVATVRVGTEFGERAVEGELNLIGQTVDEALGVLEQFLDAAVVGRLPSVRIIHGMGSGRLRAGVREHLREHPHVRSVADESGGGATRVELDL